MLGYFRYVALWLVATLLVVGCVHNDIPHRVVKLDILTLEAEGLREPAVIDASKHTVKLNLEETTDIRRVNITNVTMTEGARSTVTFPGYFDLRTPLYVLLTYYQEFEWVISAEQSIERYFTVEGQIGASEIDAVNHIVTVYVPLEQSLSDVVVTSAKLGPKDITTYTPAFEEMKWGDSSVCNVVACYHDDIEEVWSVQIIQKDLSVEFTSIDAWAKRIWLYAEGRTSDVMGFNYRKAGDEAWVTIPKEELTIENGVFSAVITDLEPMTEYEVMAFVGEDTTQAMKVTTEDVFTLPNGGFEEWHTSNKDIVFPYALGGTPFWATGNEGAAMASTTLTDKNPDIRPGSDGSYSAALQSKRAEVMGVGKFAAGNIFLGEFGGLQGLNGLVNFGRPCVARPVALHGWYKYHCGTIDEYGKTPTARPDLKKGDSDEGQILIAVGDWSVEEYGSGSKANPDCPVTVNTADESTFIDKRGKNVIGVGEIVLTESTDGWVEFTLPLEYTTTSRVPTHIIISITGSRFGDYFTGSTQSLLLVDDLELVY